MDSDAAAVANENLNRFSTTKRKKKPSFLPPPYSSSAFSRITNLAILILMMPLRFAVINRGRRARLIFFAGVLSPPFPLSLPPASPAILRRCRTFNESHSRAAPVFPLSPFFEGIQSPDFAKTRYKIYPFCPPLLPLSSIFLLHAAVYM